MRIYDEMREKIKSYLLSADTSFILFSRDSEKNLSGIVGKICMTARYSKTASFRLLHIISLLKSPC